MALAALHPPARPHPPLAAAAASAAAPSPSSLPSPQVGELPAKLNSVIQPLVAAVRRDPQPRLQQAAAAALARLALLCAGRTPSPTDKCVEGGGGSPCWPPPQQPTAPRGPAPLPACLPACSGYAICPPARLPARPPTCLPA